MTCRDPNSRLVRLSKPYYHLFIFPRTFYENWINRREDRYDSVIPSSFTRIS
jgi:hypothetical protein